MPLLLPLQFSSIEPLFTLETGRLLYKGAEKKKKTWTEKKKMETSVGSYGKHND